MRKGELTRRVILEHATSLASTIGLEGLTIGALANELSLSKSGLFAHFRSKESLQIQVLEYAAGLFVEAVVRPALQAPRGEARLRTLFQQWLSWERSRPMPGGCVFVAAAAELDDRPGPVRDKLVTLQREWLGVMSTTASKAVEAGFFRLDVDPGQFAHDLQGVMLAYHHAARLLVDPLAGSRAHNAFEALLAAARRAAPPLQGD